MFDESDPHFLRVRELALSLPEADMKVSHGRPAFFTKKVFAYFGSSVKGPPGTGGSGYIEHPTSIVILTDAEDAAVLAEDSRAYRPAYLGASGWFGIDLDTLDPSSQDGWDEVAEWLDSSYRLTAPARLLRHLD